MIREGENQTNVLTCTIYTYTAFVSTFLVPLFEMCTVVVKRDAQLQTIDTFAFYLNTLLKMY